VNNKLVMLCYFHLEVDAATATTVVLSFLAQIVDFGKVYIQ